MRNIYRFSPITNKDQLLEAIDYVAQQTTQLSTKITGREYPIGYLTIFSHYSDEFDGLIKIVQNLGVQDGANNGFSFLLHKPIVLLRGDLTRVRIRKPDPYRMQVGCDDFVVPDFIEFRNEFLDTHPDNLRLIKRPEHEMIEFFDPSFDVLAYVVSG